MPAVSDMDLAEALASVASRSHPGAVVSEVDGLQPQLLLLSAQTQPALEQASGELREFLAANAVDMADVAGALRRRVEDLPYRRFLVCRGREDALATLAEPRPQRAPSSQVTGAPRTTVLLLPGIGDHYVGMADGLYQGCQTFREEVDRCAEILEPLLGVDIRQLIYPASQGWKQTAQAKGIDLKRMLGHSADGPPDPDTIRLSTTLYSQPALFTIEYAMARQWAAFGVTPGAMIGHSMGEYVAACLAGVLSLADALRLIAVRAKLVNELPQAVMLAVMLPEAELLPQLPADISVSLINGPSHCVIAGPPDSVAALERTLSERGVIARRVQNGHAFHTRLMEPVASAFEQEVRKVSLSAPQIPYISNVTGAWITAADATDPTYWVRHLTRTARFSEALHEMWQLPEPVMVECGPGRTLTILANQHPERKGPLRGAISSIRQRYENETDLQVLLAATGRAWLAGTAIRWRGLPPDNISFGSPPSSVWSAPPVVSPPKGAATGAPIAASQDEIAPAADDAGISKREQELLAIWSRALGREDIAVNESFGALGGDSLSSIAVIMEMKRAGVPDSLARGVYQGLSIRDIAVREKVMGPAKDGGPFQLSLIETPVLIRAASIFIVVVGHFVVAGMYGAYILMMVSGLSFGKFQLRAIEREDGVRPVFRLVLKIGIPTLLWVILEELAFHSLHPRSWLFLDNWNGPYWDSHFGSPYFIDLLLQNLVLVAIPLSFRAVRRFAVRQPYTYAMAFLTAAWLANVIVPVFWNTTYLYDRLPHMWLWLFAFGWCAACSNTVRRKLLASAAVVCFGLINWRLGHSVLWYTTVAGVCIVWLEVIPLRLPRFVIPLITGAAGGSLFIYLTHFQFRSLLKHLLAFELHGGMPWPWFSVAFAMACGYLVWRAWSLVSELTLRLLRRMGVSWRAVPALPHDSGL
jgi:malonyl CoA-acyl carrier protein transacylase